VEVTTPFSNFSKHEVNQWFNNFGFLDVDDVTKALHYGYLNVGG